MSYMWGHVMVWINAFIPRDIPGTTELIKEGVNKGKTVIPVGAFAEHVHPSFWGDPSGVGFVTDQRGFSSDPKASVRVQSWARLDLSPPKVISGHDTSGTRMVILASGETHARGTADLSRCNVHG